MQNINTLCNAGSIEWISPYGALRVELSYTTGGLYEACFKIQTENVKIKVSQESWKNTKSHFAGSLPQSSLLKPLFSVNGRTNEYCLYSNTPVLLYLEPERTHDMSGFPRMKLQYVLERKTPQHLQNSLEGKDLFLDISQMITIVNSVLIVEFFDPRESSSYNPGPKTQFLVTWIHPVSYLQVS